MKILLANYNYYPYHAGGSEIYVSGLAAFLINMGHEVRILASIPVGTGETNLDFSGEQVRISFYSHAGIQVAGTWLKSESTEQIYSKYDSVHICDWEAFFRKNLDWIPDLIHLHGYTGTVNTAIVEGLRNIKSGVPFYFSYHTPVSCPKGTLYRFNQEACLIKPEVGKCTACQLHHVSGLPPSLSKIGARLLPQFKTKRMPTALKVKNLVSLEIESFGRLKKLADHWFVFSDYIREILFLNELEPGKITRIRHGIDSRFLDLPKNRTEKSGKLTFVFMGRMEKIKGILTLIKAWKNLPVSPGRELLILGELKPETKPEIQQALLKLTERPDVTFESVKSRENLISRLDTAHFLLIPSEWIEIGPLVFHEAVARGLNIISSDLGGTGELTRFYGNGCTLFKAGDVNSLLNTIKNAKFQTISHMIQSEASHYQTVVKAYTETIK